MDKYELDALLRKQREEPVIDPYSPVRKLLPFWARIGLGALALWSWLGEKAPVADEPKQAIFVTLLLFVVTVVLSELLRPKPNIEDARPAGLGDFSFPTATEARVVPLIWGTVKVEGPNVIWYGNLTQTPIRETIKTGLWTSTKITKGFTYNIGVQFGLCRGGATGAALRRIWVGDTQVWTGTLSTDASTADIDEPDLFGGQDLGNGGVQATVEFYTGSNTQAVSTYLALHQDSGVGTDRTPRYTGTSYVVARGLSDTTLGAYLGNSTTVKPWAFEVERFPAIFSGQAAGEHKIGTTECNPMNVLYEILVDVEWGFGFPSADIDLVGFTAAADTLRTELNGFSMALTSVKQSSELIKEVERQMDGVVFLDHQTGLWTVKLIRDDYDIDLVPQLTDSNVKEVRDYTRGAWEDTTNQINVKYWKREVDADDATKVYYKESFAVAQDTGNALTQGGGTVSTANVVVGEVNFPGCKSSALASNLAWRELRGQSYPLARATFVVNRQFWDLTIGDVVAWTNTQFGYTKLAMRITKIDYGTLQSNQMTLTCVQDVFRFAAASFGVPEDAIWAPPSIALADYPTAERQTFEAPRAIIVRDPAYGNDPNVSKIMAAARRQVGETGFYIQQRNAAGTPSGTFADAGQVMGFMRIGQLDAAVSAGVANPTATIAIDPTPDSLTNILASFEAVTSSEMGAELAQLILVNDEFMFVQNATDGTTVVNLNSVYRGALDSVQGNHAAGDDVYLLFVAAGLGDSNYTDTHNVHVRLDAHSSNERYTDGATPTHDSWAFAKRPQRPYPPAAVLYNTPVTTAFNVPDMEGDGAGENTFGADVTFWRRNYTNSEEIVALAADDTTVDGTHETRLRVFVDPDGVNTEIASSPFAWATGAGTDTFLRNELIDIAAAGTEIRVQLETRHTGPLGDTNLGSRYNFIHDVIPTSVNDGLFYLGGQIAAAAASNSYATVASGVFTIGIGGAHTTVVQHRINGGSWITTITSPATTGVTASLTATDTIEVRTLSSGTPDGNFVYIDNPSAVRVAYGTLSS